MVLHGFGLAWRDQLGPTFAELGSDAVHFTEVIAESALMRPAKLAAMSQMLGGVPVIPHGVSLSLGSSDFQDVGDPAILGQAVATT